MVTTRPAFLPAFTRLAAVGLLGLLGLYPTLLGLLENAARGEGPLPGLPGALSPTLLVALSLIQPGLLLLGGVALGVVLAPRVGLRSVLAGLSDRPFSRGDGAAGLLTGALTGVGLVALDALTRPLLGPAGDPLSLGRPRSVLDTLSGVLYGELTEELLLRWGVMTLLGWLYWRRNLETAMLAHASWHVAVTLLGWLGRVG